MIDIGKNIKGIWMKGMEAVGRRASDIASNTKYKVDEMNMVSRRAEIMKDFGMRAYALWQKGEKFPEELAAQLKELSELDEKLNDMRAERYASIKQEPSPDNNNDDNASQEKQDSEENESVPEGEPEESNDHQLDAMNEAGDEMPIIQVEGVEKTIANDEETESNPNLCDAINDLFQKIPSADETAEKVNGALDSLEEGLKKFSDGLDEKIDQITDQINKE